MKRSPWCRGSCGYSAGR